MQKLLRISSSNSRALNQARDPSGCGACRSDGKLSTGASVLGDEGAVWWGMGDSIMGDEGDAAPGPQQPRLHSGDMDSASRGQSSLKIITPEPLGGSRVNFMLLY